MNVMNGLAGRVVAITGAARGIGAATARAFTAAGATVAIGDIDGQLVRRTADEIGCLGALLDVTDESSVGAFLDEVEQRLGPVDVLVNNAGIMPVTPVLEESADSVRRQLAVNVAGVIYGTQQAARRMATRGSGHVVNIASAAGRMGFGGVATYSASKFAVVGFTEAVALELRFSGVQFTCVLPGVVNTELTSGIRDHWLLRSCEPEHVAEAVVQAVQRGRRTVYVPARLRAASWFYGMLSSGARTRVMAAIGADHQMLDGDPHARTDYQKRIDAD
jgi:NAD(P)-dependent dehydrogenase (short-subunit alcohol dehydrogenase family)